MIIIVCTDDPRLVRIADASIRKAPKIYGLRHQIFRNELPKLSRDEDLFIIAHGAFQGDEGQPVIGDHTAAFYLSGDQCYLNMATVFPEGYKGRVFVDACQSADDSPDIDSFITTLQTQFLVNEQNVQVYGINGASSGLIPLPEDPKWVPAQL